MKTLRLSMWSGPRNVSTALMYSFRQRSDTRVIDEPLYGHYLMEAGAHHPAAGEVASKLECDASAVIDAMLHGTVDRSVVFFKSMAHHLRGLDEAQVRDLFSGVLTHALLIRDPREMLPSLGRVLKSPALADTGLVEQRKILELELEAGRRPLVIDSRDLLLDPRRVLSLACTHLGVPFEEEMLSWPAGPKPEDGPWAPYWYGSVHRSTGFAPYQPPSDPFPEVLSDLLDECRPHFDQLSAQALKPAAS